MTSTSDRLRWIADYLGLAGKAVSVVACVRGIDYSQDIHRDAQGSACTGRTARRMSATAGLLASTPTT
jgi:hypothetical protein